MPVYALRCAVVALALGGGVAHAQVPVDAPPPVEEGADTERHWLATPRANVAWFGLAGLVGGATWFLVLGDSLGAGDPAGVLAAGGGVALVGAALGRAIDGPWAPGQADPLSAGAPALEAGLRPGGTTTIGESMPYGGDIGFAPRVDIGDVQLIVGGQVGADLGARQAVDPRADAGGGVVFESRRRSGALEPEVRWHRPAADLQLRPMAWTAVETVTHADGSERGIRREALVAALGLRCHITARQRFLVQVGPRFDALSFTETDVWSARTWTRGPLFGAVGWQFDLPAPHHIGRWDAGSRLSMGYLHSNFGGAGLDTGAIIGFFGPLTASWDLRLRPPEARHALQAGIDLAVGTGGGARLTLGWVPPNLGRRKEGA